MSEPELRLFEVDVAGTFTATICVEAEDEDDALLEVESMTIDQSDVELDGGIEVVDVRLGI